MYEIFEFSISTFDLGKFHQICNPYHFLYKHNNITIIMSQSSVLDQILLEDIARFCPNQFLAFHQCMAKPSAENKYCAMEQYNLSMCIRKDVPSFQKIQGVCAGKLQAYEACLKMNGSDVKKCSDDLKSLRDCAFDSLEN